MRAFDWQFRADHPEQFAALDAAMRFCSDMEMRNMALKAPGVASEGVLPSPRWLTLLGPSGRGKTHLARKIAEWRKTRGAGKFFYRWLDLIQEFRDDRQTIRDFMRRCDDRRLMVIDDVGAGYETEFAAATLAEIAERRVGKATVWTSNLSVEQIAGIDSRIASRMFRDRSEVFTFRSAPDWSIYQRRAVS